MENQALLLFSSPWQRLPFFQGLETKLILELLQGAEIKRTKNREVVFEQGEAATFFIFVIEGLFRLYRINSKNQRVIMDIVSSGGLIGALLMAQKDLQFPISCQSIQQGTYLKIPQETFLQSWTRHPEIVMRTQRANLERMQFLHCAREFQRYSLEDKVLHLLSRLSTAGLDLEVRMTKSDLADLVGASTESVIRLFSSWEKKGFVYKDPNGLLKVRAELLLKVK